MAILKPLKEVMSELREAEANEAYRQLFEETHLEYARPLEKEVIPTVSLREGRSLNTPVKKRFYWKRRYAGRQAGFNHGRAVTFRD